ncbi:MAG: hypothetical protein VR70_18685 [Rhodospirillaceae bacterium BRH_c57]|nr:MAG: hypothetical protein VR70_18685 [Rhodospirillaceae bacterium BRH_c57]
MACPTPAPPSQPDSTPAQRARAPRSSSPARTSATCSGPNTWPCAVGYPVWLDNWQVCTGQTSNPRRCKGNTAAELPTCPKATWDCTDRMPAPNSNGGISMGGNDLMSCGIRRSATLPQPRDDL